MQSANPNACRSPESNLKSEGNQEGDNRKTRPWEEIEGALPPQVRGDSGWAETRGLPSYKWKVKIRWTERLRGQMGALRSGLNLLPEGATPSNKSQTSAGEPILKTSRKNIPNLSISILKEEHVITQGWIPGNILRQEYFGISQSIYNNSDCLHSWSWGQWKRVQLAFSQGRHQLQLIWKKR